jgi:hypothetical protein
VNGSKYESVAILAIANAKARIILSSFHSSRAKRNAHANGSPRKSAASCANPVGFGKTDAVQDKKIKVWRLLRADLSAGAEMLV